MTIARMMLLSLIAIGLAAGFPALAQLAPPGPLPPERVFIGNAGPGIDVGQHGTPTQQYAERAYDEFFGIWKDADAPTVGIEVHEQKDRKRVV